MVLNYFLQFETYHTPIYDLQCQKLENDHEKNANTI